MRIALAQIKMLSNIQSNYEKSLQFIRQAAENKADLICFPEIQLCPFFPQNPDRDVEQYVLTEDSLYVEGIRYACRENHIFASPNFYIEENGCRYDMSLLIDDQGEIIGKQKMVHIAQCEMFYEQSYYTPSELFQWEVKVQAFQNSVIVAMCNRVGREGIMEFSGESIVVGSDGETIALADDQEELLLADVNLGEATINRNRRPYTSLRRTDLYE